MDGGRTIVVYGGEPQVATQLEAALDDASVLHSRNIGELGRVLTSGLDIEALVASIETERDWKCLDIVRQGLPDLQVLAVVSSTAPPWSGDGEHPASAMLGGSAPLADVLNALDGLVGGLVAAAVNRAPVASVSADASSDDSSGSSARIIGVFGAAGGVGTTTVTTFLALALAEQVEVVVVDLDTRHGSMASVLRANPVYTIDDVNGVKHDPERLDDALPMCLVEVGERLRLLAGPSWSTGGGDTARDLAVLCSVGRMTDVVVVDLGVRPPRDLAVAGVCTDLVVVSSHDITVAGRLPALHDAVAEYAPNARSWSVLNQIHGDGPSPASFTGVLRRGWDVELAQSNRLRRAWNEPLVGLRQLDRRSWRRLAAKFEPITHALGRPARNDSASRPMVVPATPDLDATTKSPAQPTNVDASSEEHTHV